jgi:hypothetical protein
VLEARELVFVVKLAKRWFEPQRLEGVLLELPDPFGAHPEGRSHLVLRVRAFIRQVERTVSIWLNLVLPVAAVRQVVATLVMGAWALRLLFDALLDGGVAR